MIPQDTVDRIIEAARIEDVVGDFVPLKRRGANFVACCPFHNEKTPSFYVSPAKGIFKCFGCGKVGTAVGFVMEHESLSYVDALKFLARKYGIEVVEKEESAEAIAARQRGESLMLVSEFAAGFFRDSLKTKEGRAIGYAYFRSRGLEDATIAKFGLGCAPVGRHSLADAARQAGYKEEFLIDTGLCVRREDGSLLDRFYDRVIFPIHSVSGRPIAFGGRTLKTDKSVAKYVNSPETEIYVKSRSLYGIYFARNEMSRKDRCYLVEGYLDVISMHQLGITNVVASSGTSLTEDQIRLIKRFTSNVTIIYDGDSAGIHAALRGIGMVLKEGMNVRVVLLPDGDDPDSFSKKHTLEEVSDFIRAHEQDFIEFKSDVLLNEAGDDPLKRAELINDVADTIALIPDAVKRSVYVDVAGRKFGISAEILSERISSTRAENLAEEKKRNDMKRRRELQNAENLAQDAPSDSQPASQPGAEVSSRLSSVMKVEPVTAPAGLKFDDVFLAPCEKELLGFIVESGTDPLMFDRDSEFYSAEGPVSVAEFIDSALAGDEVSFSNLIYRKVYDEYFSLYDKGFSQEQILGRLINSPDRVISMVTSDLLAEKYEITVDNYRNALTSRSTILVMYVPKSLLAYQSRRLEKMLKDSFSALETAGAQEQMELIRRIDNLNRMRALVNKKLGRV